MLNSDLIPVRCTFASITYAVDVPLKTTTVPLLMPLLTLMERPTVAFEGFEHWENNDQGCEIMLRHLEEARKMAHNADVYTSNTERILQGNKPMSYRVKLYILQKHSFIQ